MRTLKSGIVILAVIAFLAGAYFITAPKKQAAISDEKFSNIKLSSLGTAYSVTEKSNEENNLAKTLDAGLPNQIKKQNETNDPSDEQGPVNLTEFIAQSLFGQMKGLDQSGNNPFENFNPDNPESQKIIQDAIDSIQDPSSLLGQAVINDKDLKISADNSQTAKGNYLQKTAEIIFSNSNEFYNDPTKALEKIITGDFSGVNKLADTYQAMFNEFLNTPAPSDWLNLHKRYLVLLEKFSNLYRGTTDFQNDPVKTSLLVQMVPTMIETESGIKKEYYQKELEIK